MKYQYSHNKGEIIRHYYYFLPYKPFVYNRVEYTAMKYAPETCARGFSFSPNNIDPIIEIIVRLINASSGAVASGIMGNAAYDGLKRIFQKHPRIFRPSKNQKEEDERKREIQQILHKEPELYKAASLLLADEKAISSLRLITLYPPIAPSLPRRKTVETLRLLFKKQEGRPVVLHGEEGAGKTTIAAQYIKKYEKEYDVLAWFNYHLTWENTLVQQLNGKIRTFAEIFVDERDIPAIAKECLNIIINSYQNKKILIVVDNVTNPDEGKTDSNCWAIPNADILVTACHPFSSEYFHNHQIPPFSQAEVIQLSEWLSLQKDGTIVQDKIISY